MKYLFQRGPTFSFVLLFHACLFGPVKQLKFVTSVFELYFSVVTLLRNPICVQCASIFWYQKRETNLRAPYNRCIHIWLRDIMIHNLEYIYMFYPPGFILNVWKIDRLLWDYFCEDLSSLSNKRQILGTELTNTRKFLSISISNKLHLVDALNNTTSIIKWYLCLT